MTHSKEIYLSIADEMKERIKNKQYRVNKMLPSEYDLAEEFNVSRLTIRKAVDHLISKEILIKDPGKGTYIVQNNRLISGKGGLQSFTEVGKVEGKKTTTKVLFFEIIESNELKEVDLGTLLSLPQSESIYHIIRLRYFDATPMTLENLFIPVKFVPKLTKHQAKESIYHQIEKGYPINYSHQEIEAQLVDEELSHIFSIPEGDPIFLVHSIAYTASGEAVMYDSSYYRSDIYTLKKTIFRNK